MRQIPARIRAKDFPATGTLAVKWFVANRTQVNLPSVAVRSMGRVHLFLLHLAVTGNENGRAFAEGAAVVFLKFA
jgi:hypothetical protein